MVLTLFMMLVLLVLILGVAPSHTVRPTPTGYKMPDGFKAVIAFSYSPGLQVWERDLKPPGIAGGEPIDTTTQHSVTWRTLFPRSLKSLKPFTVKCAYDPDSYPVLLLCINRNQSMTFWYPNGGSIDFWAVLNDFDPDELKEGEFPMATMTITPTNSDNSMNEAGPVYNAAAGT